MEYLTVNSTLRVSVRGFTKQADADGATFKLLRNDSQKKIVDQAAAQVTKTSTLDPLTWEISIDDALITAAITGDEMQCGVSVSITAGDKTWSPPGQKFIIYRNKITLAAKDKDGANLAGARCTCTIRKPLDYHPKNPPAGGVWSRRPVKVVTADDGTAELPLDAPGKLDLVWAFPYYPEDNAAWTALNGVKRETVLLERARKARFIWPKVAQGEEQKHFVNLKPGPLPTNQGRKLRIEVGSDRGLAGDKLYLTVELTSPDTKDAAGETLKCDIEGDLEIGAEKKTITLTLDSDGGTRVVDLDFKGYGGITAKLGVSTVEGSEDETVDVTSWRKVDVQPYHPAAGFFSWSDKFPDTLAKKVKESFDEVFIDVQFLNSKFLRAAFPGIEEPGRFEIVKIPSGHAKDAGLDPGKRGGDLVYFKMDRFVASTPMDWITKFAKAHGTTSETKLRAVFAHACYEPRAVSVSLILSGDKLVSEPQTAVTALTARNLDIRENHGNPLLPWSSGNPSYWQVEGEKTRGNVTMDFIEFDLEKAKQGQYEYKIKLPDRAPGDPKKLAASGKRIKVNVNLRSYEFGGAGANLAPYVYIGLDPDYASSRCAYAVIHEIAHALGFAPAAGEFFYGISGSHCANGIKSDAEAYVGENQGTAGATVGETLSKGIPGRNVPLELAAAGKFGTCVMWGHTHRQKTTEDMFAAALKFCSSCAPLIRVTPIGSIVGGER